MFVPVCITKCLQHVLYVSVWACETCLVKSGCMNICRSTVCVSGGIVLVCVCVSPSSCCYLR